MKPEAILSRLSILLLGILLLVSCGKKTAPVPPQTVIPAPITGAIYQLDESGVSLSWLNPLRTDQGKKLGRIDSFIIERAEYPASEFCRDCPVHYRNIASLSVTGETGAQTGSSYRDEDLKPGYIYLYRVRTSMGWGVTSLPSKPLVFTWQLPLAAVSDLKAESGDQQIELRWQPPTTALDGAPVTEPLQYQVFRSVSGSSFLPLDNPVAVPYFKDSQITNGIDYQYRIRAARLSGGTGALSSPVKAIARDLTPPPVPRGLTTTSVPEGTRLFWEPVVAADLGGYQIFRRSDTEELTPIGEVGSSKSSFVDPTPEDQQIYYYRVKAFDRSVPANQSPFSEETRTGQ